MQHLSAFQPMYNGFPDVEMEDVFLPGHDEHPGEQRKSTNINDLPFDVLFTVFSLVAEHHAQDPKHNRPLTYPLNSVCRHWHDVVPDVPVLHTRINISSVLPEMLAILQRYLERSRERQVTITVSHHQCRLECTQRKAEVAKLSPVFKLRAVLIPHVSRISTLVLKNFSDTHLRMLTLLPLQAEAVNMTGLKVSHAPSTCSLFSEEWSLPLNPTRTIFNTVIPWITRHNQASLSNLTSLDLHLPTWTQRQLVNLFRSVNGLQHPLLNLALRELYPTNYRPLDDMHSDPDDTVFHALGKPIVMPALQTLNLQNLNAKRARAVLSSLSFPLTTRVGLDFGGHSGPVLPVDPPFDLEFPSLAFLWTCRSCPVLTIRLFKIAPPDGQFAPFRTMLQFDGEAQSETSSWSAQWSWLPSERDQMSVLSHIDSDLLDARATVLVGWVSIIIYRMSIFPSPSGFEWAQLFVKLQNIVGLVVRLHTLEDFVECFASLARHLSAPDALDDSKVLPLLAVLCIDLGVHGSAEQYCILHTMAMCLWRRWELGHTTVATLRIRELSQENVDPRLQDVLANLRGMTGSLTVQWVTS